MAKKCKLLMVEDGSVDLEELEKIIAENKLPIQIIVYRQGARAPYFLNEE